MPRSNLLLVLLSAATFGLCGAFAPAPSSRAKLGEPSSFGHSYREPLNVISTKLYSSQEQTAPIVNNDAVRAKSFLLGDTLSELSKGYQKLSKENYLALAFVQAGVLASSADIATQTMESAGRIPIDYAHVAAMATVASTMSGVMNAIWLRQLEAKFPGTELKNVATKTLIHAIIIASIINSAYLAGVPLLSNYIYHGTGLPEDLSLVFSGWSMAEFIILTKLEIAMFIPYNTLAFKFVPPQVRPLTHAAISATFNIAVSAVTLGYFDSWCDRAMHLLGQS